MSHILRENPSEEGPEIGEPITADIYRFDPSSESQVRIQRFVVPYRRRLSIFTLLREIYEHQDPTLAFRNQQCGRGICGTCRCTVELKGKTTKGLKTCTVPLEPGEHVVINPYNESMVVRDIVVDF
jgi:succinate dehydrogenase/fumarate reductase-like Fe-S protein